MTLDTHNSSAASGGKIPAFRHMGGKARLRKWLIAHFPDSGSIYLEPFAGKGNVFYEARQRLQFEQWILSDLDTRFFQALWWADLSLLPEAVSKSEFEHWKQRKDDYVSILIEPRITYAGKGYKFGYSGSSGTHVGYSGPTYRKVCEQARALLADAQVVKMNWEDSIRAMNPDFVYLDPPYYGTVASYENIDHERLVDVLNNAKFLWALSGYRNSLYDAKLDFKCRFEYERNSEIKSSNSGKREAVIETLWTNYEL